MAIEDEGWPLFNGYLFVYFIVVCVVSECQFLISEVAVIGERRFVLSIKEVQMSVHWKSTPSAHLYSNTQLECVLSIFSVCHPKLGCRGSRRAGSNGETVKHSCLIRRMKQGTLSQPKQMFLSFCNRQQETITELNLVYVDVHRRLVSNRI